MRRLLSTFFGLLLVSASPAMAAIQFVCPSVGQDRLRTDIRALSESLDVVGLVDVLGTQRHVELTLGVPWSSVPTYEFHLHAGLNIATETVMLPLKDSESDESGEMVSVATVSRREILLALAHPARKLVFEACDVSPLLHELGVRQSIVAWSENMDLGWPDGGPAKWNTKFWSKGTPVDKNQLHQALRDPFVNPNLYSVGCYTAAKLLVAQGVMDYVRRVAGDPRLEQVVFERLYRDDDPLVNIEPPVLWAWEDDFNPQASKGVDGKLLRIDTNINEHSIVPGDWLYFINTHSPSKLKVGYEGSNAIYTGMNRFASYYNKTRPRDTTLEKVNDVYQWRHGVFDRPADLDKEKPLSEEELKKLLRAPREGGLLFPLRVVPHHFEDLSNPFGQGLQATEKILDLIQSELDLSS